MLKTIAEKLHTNVSAEADNWQDAIRMCCRPLVESGAVSVNYAEEVIRACNERGPYILVAPGVAMPQATVDCTRVTQTEMSFLQLKKPVALTEGDASTEAALFVVLVACNHDEQMILVQKLMRIFENEEILDGLKRAKSETDLMQLWELAEAS